MAADVAITTTVGTSVTTVTMPGERDMYKIDIYDAAGTVIVWVCLDNTVTSFAPGDANTERIKPNSSILVPGAPSYRMITEAGTASVNVVAAKGRL